MSTMCPEHHLRRRHSPPKLLACRGFAIISGIFMLLLIAALAALMMTLSTSQSAAAAQDVQGSRAYQAAHAGIEWTAYSLLILGACPVSPAPNFPGFTDFTVTVTCVPDGANAATDTTNPVTPLPTQVWVITSTASLTGANVGAPNYVERQLQVTIEK